MKHRGKQLTALTNLRKRWSDDELSSSSDEEKDRGDAEAQQQGEVAPEPAPAPAPPVHRTVFNPPQRGGKGAGMVAMKRPRLQYPSSDEDDDDDDKPQPPAPHTQTQTQRRQQADEEEEEEEEYKESEEEDEEASEESESSEEEESDDEPKRKTKRKPKAAAKPAARRGKAPAKKAKTAEPAAAAKKQPAKRAAAQEEEEDDSSSDDDPNDPNRHLYKDAADRRYLKSLTEYDREDILFKRHEEWNRQQQLAKLQQIAATKSTAPKAATRKQAAGGRGRGSKTSARAKKSDDEDEEEEDMMETDDKPSGPGDGMDFVDQESEDEDGGKGRDDEEEEDDDAPRKASAPAGARRLTRARAREEEEDDMQDMQVEEEDDDMEVDNKKRPAGKEELTYDPSAPVASLEDMRKVQLKRHLLERWAIEPFFKSAVRGGFVRVNMDSAGTMDHKYYLAEITDVIQGGRQYHSGKLRCDIYLKMTWGGETLGNPATGVPIRNVSNGPVTEEEYESWISKCRDHRSRLPTPDEINNRINKRKNAVFKHDYTEAEITEQMELRKKWKVGQSKKEVSQGLGKKKAHLTREIDIKKADREKILRLLESGQGAEETGSANVGNKRGGKSDDATGGRKEDLHKVEKEIEDLQAELQKVLELIKQESKKAEKTYGAWSSIAEKGQKERLVKQDTLGSAAVQAANRMADEADPFQRTRTNPKVLWKVSGAQDSKEEAKAAVAAAEKPSKNPVPAHTRIEDLDELIEGFDPLRMLDDPSLNKYMPRQQQPPQPRRSHKVTRLGLSWKDYMQRAEGPEGPVQ